MGVVFALIRVPTEAIAALADRPKAVAQFVYGDASLYKSSGGFLSRLLGQKTTDETPVPVRREGDEIDLDKSWHIIHYLLTGTDKRADGPLALIAEDRHPLADIDLGLSKPNVVSPGDVRAFAEAAAVIDEGEFLQRFDPNDKAFKKLYLGKDAAANPEEFKAYALEYFNDLRDFVGTAANEGEALITYYG